ncbi:hypothetical protein GLOTRDRAFT_56722 [Gloeophyllum trabeum ATCC 11539]|uniref:Protein transport protein sec16 n=1 Tax=Gloeophyllum trabeum (strain ATCC 11539 / FP-39264 / Madison 617) TaxID=670483 RepID=S7QE77_GLOTA|nr:uncharacterized protein GLOTRDRAFT_56722 [Gloeophyllum trabeum ATCC 11539]EPQ58106.1 hypothetical protein GLOTRDRAFT_56722 [Gloeophyllum trabeum ATCC 11539]
MYGGGVSLQSPPSSGPKTAPAILEDDPENPMTSFQDTFETGRTYQPRQEGVAAQTSLESSSDSSVLTTDAAESGSGRVSSPDRMPAESSSNPEEDNQNSKGAPVLPSPPPRSSYSYEPQPSSSRSSLDKHMPAESPARSPPPPSINRSSLDRYAPAKSATVSPPPAAINGYAVPVYDPYKPSQRDNDPPQQSAQRAKSPGATSVRSYTSSLGGQSASSVASRSQSPTVHLPARDRAMSNGIPFGPAQPPANANPYTPVYGIKRESSEVSDYGDSWTSRSYPSVEAGHIPITTASEPDRGQDIYLSAPARAPYAPSPTLLGANDPLGRVAARAPLMSFGFGGKLLTCFHGSSSLSTGFDVALSSRPSTDIQMRTLHTLLPESASGVAVPAYPGPLFSDPGTPTTTSLVRTNASQVKAKKARVLKYLEEKEEEISRAVGYLTRGSSEHRRAEGKLVLVKLLKIMVENDGKLSGSDSVDAAARSALVPRIQATSNSNETGLSAAADLSLGYPGLGSSQPNETPLASYIVKPSTLDKIQDFLLRGERRKACHYALDEKLWAHAMLIASSIDKEAWKEVVHEFLRTELGYQSAGGHGASLGANGKAADPGRTSLRVAYSLFAGEGASSVQEMVPPKLLSKTTSESLQVPHPVTPMAPTPISPNFPSAALTTSVPEDVLADWPETAAMLLSNPMTADASSALTTLGDYLAANHWVEAAHACYLLSPQTSAIGGAGSPSVRLVLVGSPSPQNFTRFGKDHDPIIFSEIAEFALSLAPTTKGQETFAGLPHLQAYRLIRAATLAELGHVQLANRYCEAIRSSLSRQSPYFNVVFMHCLRELSDRLVAAPQVDKAGSWIGGKMSKPSLDSIGSWVGGRLTKFIAGDEDKSPTDDPLGRSSQDDNTFSGPFTHYSAISSTVPSHTPSPAPSVQSLNFASASPPPRRSGSAMALRPNLTSDVHVDRASSAMDYTRPSARKSSPAPRLGSSDTSSSSPYGQVPSFGQVVNGYGAANGYGGYPSSPMAPSADGSEASQNGSSWWNGYGAENDSVTPTASSFNHTNDAEGGADSSNFISLMDDQMMTPMASQTSAAPSRGISYDDEDIEDDLGIGNPTKKSKADKAETKEPGKPSPTETSNNKPDTDKPALSSTSSSSWLSRLWKRESTPTPVKANLGEEVTFYYDKELKRWVNKKAGADAAQPKPPPPPPSRAQTASPSRSAPGVTPPPARPASAVDLTISPPKKPPMRVRSNLVPEGVESAPTTPAAHAGLDVPPPPGRPKSGMAKRSARSRYVDVFQSQPGS